MLKLRYHLRTFLGCHHYFIRLHCVEAAGSIETGSALIDGIERVVIVALFEILLLFSHQEMCGLLHPAVPRWLVILLQFITLTVFTHTGGHPGGDGFQLLGCGACCHLYGGGWLGGDDYRRREVKPPILPLRGRVLLIHF